MALTLDFSRMIFVSVERNNYEGMWKSWEGQPDIKKISLCGSFKQIKSQNLSNQGVILSPCNLGPYNMVNLLWNNKQKIIVLKGQRQDTNMPL